MKILQICSYLYPALAYGGPAKVAYDLSVELAKHQSVTIYTTDVWDQYRRIRRSEKLRSTKSLRVLYFRNIINSWAYTARLFTGFGMVTQFIKEHHHYRIVHLHDVYIIPQLFIGYLCLWFKMPLVISPHGVLDPVRTQRRTLIKSLLWVVVKPLLAKANTLIATSSKEETDLRQLGFKRVVTIPNGVSEINVKPSNRFSTLKSTKRTLLYIGKLHPQKGLLELVKAYEQFQDQYQLIIAGPDDGILSTLEALKKTEHLKHMHLVGYVNDADKQALLTLADIFVYPSHAEGFSISILEALQRGLPVLITEGCNFPEVKTYQAGLVIKGKYLERELKVALKSLSVAKNVKNTYGKHGRKLIKQKYSIEQMGKSCLEIYQQYV